MCDAIRANLLFGNDGQTKKVNMAVIGFDYNPFGNPALVNCVGEDNVYKAENPQELYAQILSLIAEEIGRLR